MRTRFAPIFLAACAEVLLMEASLAQDVAAVHNEAVQHEAIRLLDAYDVVALGTFDGFPPSGDDLLTNLVPTDVVLKFNIKKLYKGSAGDSMDVALNSDMLVCPGEQISRYSKRREVRRQQIAAAQALDRETADLEDALRLGNLTNERYREERARLDAERDRLVSESLATSTRMRQPLHLQTFYDLGGAIAPNELFLIGVNRSADPSIGYELEELASTVNRNIFWGTALEEASRAIAERSTPR